MKAFILILLISVALQVHAQDGGGGQELSEKSRLEKLEKAVCELGAERERARAAKQEAKTNTLIERNICDSMLVVLLVASGALWVARRRKTRSA